MLKAPGAFTHNRKNNLTGEEGWLVVILQYVRYTTNTYVFGHTSTIYKIFNDLC